MKSLTGEKSRLLVTIIVLVALNAVALSLWGIGLFLTRSTSHSYQEKLHLLSDKEASLESVRSLKDLLKNTEDAREKLSAIFVTKETLPIFLDGLKELAEKSRVVLSPAALEEHPDSLRMQFQVSGRFVDLYYFINLVEHMPYPISFDSFSMTKTDATALGTTTSSGGGSVWRADASMVLGSYSSK